MFSNGQQVISIHKNGFFSHLEAEIIITSEVMQIKDIVLKQ